MWSSSRSSPVVYATPSMSLNTSVIDRVGGIHDLSISVYRSLRTVSTACSRAEAAWTRRRNSREPSDERSRSSSRRRGFRRGLIFDADDLPDAELLLVWAVLCSVLAAGGSAEGCGAGGELDVGLGDMVWNIFGVAEEVILLSTLFFKYLKKKNVRQQQGPILRCWADVRQLRGRCVGIDIAVASSIDNG